MEHHLAICAFLCVLICVTHATTEGETLEFGEEFLGLKAEILVAPSENCERYSQKGDLLTVHYRAYLATDMSQFDSSYDRGKGAPEVFHIGTLEKNPAWDLGLQDMCVGEKRKLIVPAKYGFGEYGSRDGKVPPHENLIYEFELLKIADGPVQGPLEAFENIDTDKDGFLTMEEVGKHRWKFVKKYPNEHAMYRKDMNLFRDSIWQTWKRFDYDLDGFQTYYEHFFTSSVGKPSPPKPEYYLS